MSAGAPRLATASTLAPAAILGRFAWVYDFDPVAAAS